MCGPDPEPASDAEVYEGDYSDDHPSEPATGAPEKDGDYWPS